VAGHDRAGPDQPADRRRNSKSPPALHGSQSSGKQTAGKRLDARARSFRKNSHFCALSSSVCDGTMIAEHHAHELTLPSDSGSGSPPPNRCSFRPHAPLRTVRPTKPYQHRSIEQRPTGPRELLPSRAGDRMAPAARAVRGRSFF
jgi:hypothetical protein